MGEEIFLVLIQVDLICSDPDLVVEELADKLTNKLLHTTFENIKKSPKISLEQSQDSIPVSKKPTNIHNL